MTSKLFSKFFVTLITVVSIGTLSGCTALRSPSESLTPATPTVCDSSRIQTSKIDFPEIQGTMSTEGEMWALLFFDKGHAKEELKIVWRITGSGKDFTVQAKSEDGTVVGPIWGPIDHGGSSWDRPGYEWGTGFNFPEPGCWTFTVTRGTTIGEIRLNILAP
jgi:hypothetical protein